MCGVEYCLACDMVYHIERTCEEVQKEKEELEAQEKAYKINK